MAKSHGSASVGRNRWRLTMYCAARSRALSDAVGAFMMSLAAIKPRRFDQKHEHGDRVNEEATRVGKEIFARGIANAEHQRRQQRAFEAAEPTDGDDDQEQHEINDGEARIKPEQLDGKPAAERSKPRSERERERKQPVDIDAHRLFTLTFAHGSGLAALGGG